MTLTVIIPALDEAAHLPSILPRLTRGADEVIVVDGGSRDGSLDAVRAAAGVQLLQTDPSRAGQMNLGAAHARGDILLFVHADALPPPGFAPRIAEALADPGVVGGAFDLEILAEGLVPRVISRMASWRSRVTRSPYGDQGIFVRRSVFEAMRGFNRVSIMEDLDFTHRLHRRGRVCLLPERIGVSARRWQVQGYLRTTLVNTLLAGCFYLGIDGSPLVRWTRPVRG